MEFSVGAHLAIPESDLVFRRVIGKGSFGEVWEGQWNGRGGGETVAIKKISIYGIGGNVLKDLYAEADILSKLMHRNILRIFGVTITTSEMWIVLEYMDGGSLYDLLQSKPLPWENCYKLAVQAAKALNFLHSSEPPILHRDIKSLNFLVTKDGSEVKLTDFGMAKIKSSSSSATSTTSAGGVGSFRWAAPETFSAKPNWTTKADVYSLGVTFWELVARQLPFADVADTMTIIFTVKMEGERPTIPDNCPKPFAEIIQKCWAQDASARPTTVELLQMLEAIKPPEVASSPSPSPGPTPSTPKRLFFEVNKALLLQQLPDQQLRVLTTPPPFPPNHAPPSSLPSEVKIAQIKRIQVNPLLSGKLYTTELFERVEVYFRRFFSPRDSSHKVTLDQVDVILNDALENRFKEAEQALNAKCRGLAEFKDPDQNEMQRFYLNKLLASDNLVDSRNSNPVSAWHGASLRHLDSIAWYGLLNLSTTDPGYFGKGIYLTQQPKYGEYYAETVKEKSEGQFRLLLCWVLLGKTYAVTKVAMGQPCKVDYNTHYTLVSKKRSHPKVCNTTRDYDAIEGLTTYLPLENQGEEIQGDEICVFQEAHILPRYIVHYSVTAPTPSTPPPKPAPAPQPNPPPQSAPKPAPQPTPPPSSPPNLQLNKDLCVAARNGNTPMIEALIKRGADVNTLVEGVPPLVLALLNHQFNAAMMIITFHPNTDLRGNHPYSPLHIATLNMKPDMVELLLSYGASVNLPNAHGKTALTLAQESDALKKAGYVSIERKNMWEAVNRMYMFGASNTPNAPGGWTNMHAAAYRGAALPSGDVNVATLAKNTPLHVAAWKNRKDTVIELLRRGASPHVLNIHTENPLHSAVRYDNDEIVDILIKAGSNIHQPAYPYESPPLFVACVRGAPRSARLLLRAGANKNLGNAGKTSPISVAAMYDNPECVKILLEARAEINTQDIHGYGPLQLAAFYGSLESARILALAGAKVLLDKAGKNAIQNARDQGHHHIAAELERILKRK